MSIDLAGKHADTPESTRGFARTYASLSTSAGDAHRGAHNERTKTDGRR
jgi:hypothetical protein